METSKEKEEIKMEMETIQVLNQDKIYFPSTLEQIIQQILSKTQSASKYCLLTDTNIYSLYYQIFIDKWSRLSNKECLCFKMEPGENHKTRRQKEEIEDWMLQEGYTRDCVLICLGGGVVGDLGGFVASTFMRGIKYFQIPTTLLAMVDSSIGGKTAVDVPHGKNLIGSFYEPIGVFIWIGFLDSLNDREFCNGMAEVIKYGCFWSQEFFNYIFLHNKQILKRSKSHLSHLIHHSAKIKSQIVTHDQKENNLRSLLNFGHTIGHAIETLLYPRILHGEAIALGMVLEAEVSRAMGCLKHEELSRIIKLLKLFGLPVSFEDLKSRNIINSFGELGVEKMMEVMKVDKKNIGTEKRIVLLSGIGKTFEQGASCVNDGLIRRVISPSIVVYPFSRSTTNTTTTTDSHSHSPTRYTINCPGSKSISNRALLLAALGNGECRLKGLLYSDDTGYMMDALSILSDVQFRWEGGDLVVTGTGGVFRSRSGTMSGSNVTKKSEGGGKSKGVGGEGSKSSSEVEGEEEEVIEVYLGNAGTAVRFLTTVVQLITTLPTTSNTNTQKQKSIILTGNERMKNRPIGPLINALRNNGCQIEYLGMDGCLPLKVRVGALGLKGGRIELSARISSQYVSSILLSAPYAEEEVILCLGGGDSSTTTNTTKEKEGSSNEVGGSSDIISKPYIKMTVEMMKHFGINVRQLNDHTYQIPKGQYRNPPVYQIEPDASSATYPLALAGLSGREVEVLFLGRGGMQGDSAFALEVLERMGCEVEQGDSTTVRGRSSKESGLSALGWCDMENMTDAFLTASVLAAISRPSQTPHHKSNVPPKNHPIYKDPILKDLGISNMESPECDGWSVIYGVGNQRVKECNRIFGVVSNLRRFGVECFEIGDGLVIRGGLWRTTGCSSSMSEGGSEGVVVETYDDHRVAMSFSLLALYPGLYDGCTGSGTSSSTTAAAGSESISNRTRGTVILEKKCVEKTWPEWWDILSRVFGVRLEGSSLFPVSHTAAAPTTAPTETTAATGELPGLTEANQTIVLIGMRGAGKTSLASNVSKRLGIEFLDLDMELERREGRSIGEIVKREGWGGFRSKESGLLREVLSTTTSTTGTSTNSSKSSGSTGGSGKSSGSGRIISCGGGIIECEENRKLLKQYIEQGGVVIHIQREIGEIVEYLMNSSERHRPGYSTEHEGSGSGGRVGGLDSGSSSERESGSSKVSERDCILNTWNRRREWYRQCSNYDFYIVSSGSAGTGTTSNTTTDTITGTTKESRAAPMKDSFDVFEQFVKRLMYPNESKERILKSWCRTSSTTDNTTTSTTNTHTTDNTNNTDNTPSYEDISPIIKTQNDHENSSFFLSLTYSTIEQSLPQLDEILAGCQYLELRVDLLNYKTIEELIRGYWLLRGFLCSDKGFGVGVGVIWTVRSLGQGGMFEDGGGSTSEGYWQLVELGYRLGCEMVDIEYDRVVVLSSGGSTSRGMTGSLSDSRTSLRVISFHDLKNELSWDTISTSHSDKLWTTRIKDMSKYGEILKCVGISNTFHSQLSNTYHLSQLSHHQPPHHNDQDKEILEILKRKPLIAIQMCQNGILSRLLNRYMTPVTHELLPSKAAPGQISVSEVIKVRKGLGLVTRREYYLFGYPIRKSLSPFLHNNAFRLLGYHDIYTYQIHERNPNPNSDSHETMQEWVTEIKQKNGVGSGFAGASVTIPYKEIMLEYCDILSDDVVSVGCLNTIVVNRDGKWVGENTDWIGIMVCLERAISLGAKLESAVAGGSQSVRKSVKGVSLEPPLRILILGAGGTAKAACFAISKLTLTTAGMKKEVYMWNRTHTKLRFFRERYGVSILGSNALNGEGLWFDVVVNTLPGDVQSEYPQLLNIFSNTTPINDRESHVGDNGSGRNKVFLEMAYQPRVTLFMHKARENGWRIIEGYEVLLEQGFEQLRLWMGNDVYLPRHTLRQLMVEHINSTTANE